MSGSFGALNTKYNILLNELRNKTGGGGGGPTTSPLSVVLANGNSAGASDIDMNSNDILQVNNINLSSINGVAYPTYPTLQQVLTAGTTATNSVTLNNSGSGTNVINLLPNASASNPQITLTDGTTTNTIDKNGYTTRNTTANATHYLDFSDSSSTGTGAIQKTAGIECNPSTKTITATTFVGAVTGTATNASAVSLTSDNTSGTYYIPFSKTTTATGNALYIDNTTTPLSYNPSLNTLTLGTGTLTNAVSASSMNMTNGTTTLNQSTSNWRMTNSAGLYTNITPTEALITDGTSTTTLNTSIGCRVTGPTNTSQMTSGTVNVSNNAGTTSCAISTTQIQVNNSGLDISTLSNFQLNLVNSTNSTSCNFQNSGRGTMTSNAVGYNSTPTLTIVDSLATAGATTGVPSIKYNKSGRNAVAGDVIASQHYYANNSAGTSTEFARIEASVRNTGVGNDDGSIALSGLINGVMTEFFRVNGADSENNMFLPVDMNGQSIKSSSGDLNLTASSSSGTGQVTLASKAQVPTSTNDMVFSVGGATSLAHSTANGWNFQANNLTTTGNITCNTLNYTTLNPPVTSGGVFASVVLVIANTTLTGASAYNKVYAQNVPGIVIIKLPVLGTSPLNSLVITICTRVGNIGDSVLIQDSTGTNLTSLIIQGSGSEVYGYTFVDNTTFWVWY